METPAKKRWILPVLIFPVNILLCIPAVILWFTNYHWEAMPPLPLAAAAGALLLCGLSLAAWTVRLFHSIGRGTAAPWNPPQRMVVAGPYRHVRNPMLSSVFIMQSAEALLLNSRALCIFIAFFVIGCMLYVPLVEEKKLETRFGEAYRLYRRHVPRWIPRLSPWRMDDK